MRKGVAALLAASVFSLAPGIALAKESTPKKKPSRVVHVCKKTDVAVDALACNIYMESRGENITGQMAIGFVTLNRLKNEKFPTSVRKVVYQSSQFSWTKVTYNVRDGDSWKVAKEISKFLYSIRNHDMLYKQLDPTGGSIYFHNVGSKPYWAKYLVKTVVLGGHVFYKPKEAA